MACRTSRRAHGNARRTSPPTSRAAARPSSARRAPPEKGRGLQAVETRYRQRYADLIANEEVRAVFETRSKIVSSIRRFLDARGFIEVETPTLETACGGGGGPAAP